MKRKIKKGAKRRFFDGKPEGEVVTEGALIRIRFTFSPHRIRVLKELKGRFDPSTKSWTLPIASLPALQASPFFSTEKITYLTANAKQSEGVAVSTEEALQKLSENCFSLHEKYINALFLDVVIRISKKSPSLRANVRFGSPAKGIIEKLTGAHFIASERSYYIPTVILPELLKKLRDRSLLFAVEEVVGSRLKETASIRGGLLKNLSSDAASGSALEKCLLTPYISRAPFESEVPLFTLKGATAHQLGEVFPDVESFHARVKVATAFDEETLLRATHQSRSSNCFVYLSYEVQKYLNSRRGTYQFQLKKAGGFEDSLLHHVDSDTAWILNESNEGTLLVKRESAFLSQLDEVFKGERILHSTITSHYVFTCGDSKLEKVYGEVSAIAFDIPESKTFREKVEEVRRRRLLIDKNKSFLKTKDLALSPALFPHASSIPSSLFPHQRVGVSWLLETERAFLGDDMGLGKTLSVLAAAEALFSRGEIELLLVICPNSLTRNWNREADRWLPHRTTRILPRDKSEKKLFLNEINSNSPHILALNYEGLRLEYVLPAIMKLAERKKTLLCVDESQRVKNHASKTFQALLQIAPFCKRRVLLSGTPTPKDLTDIWSQMRLLDDGARFGEHFYDWLRTVAELGNEYSDVALKRFKPGAENEIIYRVREVLLRRKKENVVKLPPKLFVTRDVELTGEQAKRYEEICSELLLRVTTLSGAAYVREIENVLEEYLRAVQVAANPRLIDPYWQGDPAKFRELDLIVDEVVRERDGKLVIWTNYLGNVRELVERYKELGAAPLSGEVSPAVRDETLTAFQTEKLPKILVAVPAAGGVGITLTAATTAVYIDKTWNAEHWLQSIDRIHRIGQTGTVTIVSLSACKVDEVIARNLKKKEEQQKRLLGDKAGNGEEFLSVGTTENLPSRDELLEALQSK